MAPRVLKRPSETVTKPQSNARSAAVPSTVNEHESPSLTGCRAFCSGCGRHLRMSTSVTRDLGRRRCARRAVRRRGVSSRVPPPNFVDRRVDGGFEDGAAICFRESATSFNTEEVLATDRMRPRIGRWHSARPEHPISWNSAGRISAESVSVLVRGNAVVLDKGAAESVYWSPFAVAVSTSLKPK